MRRRSLIAGAVAAAVSLWTDQDVWAATPLHRHYYGLHDASERAPHHIRYGSLRLHDAGVAWRDIETAQGVYNWTRLDQLVNNAIAHDVELALVLGYTPAWMGNRNTPPDLAAFTTFATAVLTRYKGRIRTYSPWNEVNDPQFWAGTSLQMTALCQALSDVRATVDPRARLLSPSFQTTLRYQRVQLERFLSRSWTLFDAVGVSLYPPAGYGPERMAAIAKQCRGRMDQAGVPRDMPLWGTEVNYGVRGRNRTTRLLSRWDQAAMVVRTYALGSVSGLERIHWYRWDWKLVGGAPLANTLLSHPANPDDPTVAGLAVNTAHRWLGGGRPHLKVASDGTHRVVVTTPRARKTIVWNPRHQVLVEAPAAAFRVHRINGTSRRIGTNRKIRVGGRPKMIEVRL